MTLEVRFRVKCARLYPYQSLFAVGDSPQLGNWQPTASLELSAQDESREIWIGRAEVPETTKELHFRYFIGYRLDSASEGSRQQIIVSRWEAALNPRRCLPSMEASKTGVVREGCLDEFGKYDGKQLLGEGWVGHQNEHVVLLRIHGEALKFYKQRFKTKVTRLKVVPFDVRFKETFCPYDVHRKPSTAEKARGILWRLSSVYARTRDTVEEELPEEEKDPVLPDVPSFSITELSVLTRDDPIFGEQYVNGSVFRNEIDYLVFRTRTVSIEHLAFRIELYHERQRAAMAYALPATLPDTYGKSTFPIICNQHMPVGQLDVDYMLVKPLGMDQNIINTMAVTYGRYWRKRKTLEVGHRGMGNSYTKIACERENTIQSLKQAGKNGADLVEFDVQLTKDMLPVIYHDFHVLVEVAHRTNMSAEKIHEEVHHEMAIKDLKLAQLNLLHFEHVHVKTKQLVGSDCERVIPTPAEISRSLEQADANDEDYNPFPALETALRTVNQHVGFNIEVKYPMQMKDGTHECAGYFERNQYVDTILKCVFSFAGDRRILFSCFDPDVCTLLAQKQHRFPVLFLVVGATTRYMPFRDIRSDCSKMAVHYAAANGLLGVNFHSEELLADKTPLRLAEKYQLVTFVWGDDLNQRKHQDYFKRDLKVDGLIYDRIGEFEQRQNVFLVEKSARETLFAKSPLPSRPQSRASSRRSSVEYERNGRENSRGPGNRRRSQEI